MKKLTTFIALALTVFVVFFAVPTNIQAAECSVDTVGECVGGYICKCGGQGGNGCYFAYRDINDPCGSNTGSEVIGRVQAPDAVKSWNLNNYGSGAVGGGIAFFSTIIRLITIVAGIFVMINFVLAGFKYITSMGNTNANIEVRDKIMFSVIGLLIIVSAYTIAGLFGLIFFGDAGFILRPTITGALDL